MKMKEQKGSSLTHHHSVDLMKSTISLFHMTQFISCENMQQISFIFTQFEHLQQVSLRREEASITFTTRDKELYSDLIYTQT